MRPLELLGLIAIVLLVLGLVQLFHLVRALSMRRFAARRGLRYVGPLSPRLWHPSRLHVDPDLPEWLSRFYPSGKRIRQIWNVVEGEHNGVKVLICDTFIGDARGRSPCTLIACQTETNPFGPMHLRDRITQTEGWTILHGAWFMQFPRAMGIRRIEENLDRLRAAQQGNSGQPPDALPSSSGKLSAD